LTIDVGDTGDQICNRARWVDLVVVSLAHPPPQRPVARLQSGFRDLIQRCPQPVLAVPRAPAPLERGLVAYDGSPRADEALFIAAYLALRWRLGLAVVTVLDPDGAAAQIQERAWQYLERRGVPASYVTDRGPIAETLLRTAEAHRADLLIMGGYGFRPVLEIMLGSTVDHVLRTSHLPILVCR
jgi:nucleotide-binding universal stress UspA family protein